MKSTILLAITTIPSIYAYSFDDLDLAKSSVSNPAYASKYSLDDLDNLGKSSDYDIANLIRGMSSKRTIYENYVLEQQKNTDLQFKLTKLHEDFSLSEQHMEIREHHYKMLEEEIHNARGETAKMRDEIYNVRTENTELKIKLLDLEAQKINEYDDGSSSDNETQASSESDIIHNYIEEQNNLIHRNEILESQNSDLNKELKALYKLEKRRIKHMAMIMKNNVKSKQARKWYKELLCCFKRNN